MKIAIFYNKFEECGGVEKSIYTFCKMHSNHDITVFFNNKDSNFQYLLNLSKYAKIKKYEAADENFDVAIYHTIRIKKIDADKHIQVLNTILDFTKVKIDRTMDLYIAPGEKCANQFKEQTGLDCKVVPNLIDIEEIKEKSLKNTKIEKAKLNLVTVSRISQEKGFERILKFVQELERNKINYVWNIIGSGKKEYEEIIKKQFKKYDKVIFLGFKENPYPYIKNADYLVQLSDNESQCISMYESLILGTQVIVTDFAKDIITNELGIVLDKDLTNLSTDKLKPIKIDFDYSNYDYEEILKPISIKDKKFTILIPNYNNAEYLERCLKSVLEQTYTNYEIIFVDDMSTDNSVEITERLLKEHKVITNKTKRYNGGTRNVGIAEMTGDYLICIDSDDFLNDNKVLEKLNKKIKNEDVIFLSYCLSNGERHDLSPLYPKYETLKEAFEQYSNTAIWTKCISKRVLDRIYKKYNTWFPEGTNQEDRIFHYKTIMNSNTFSNFKEITHIWNRANRHSVTTKRNLFWDTCTYKLLAEYILLIEDAAEYKQYLENKLNVIKSNIENNKFKQI